MKAINLEVGYCIQLAKGQPWHTIRSIAYERHMNMVVKVILWTTTGFHLPTLNPDDRVELSMLDGGLPMK